ncbi:hypothetical protein [Devosia sp. 2618]|uniref:pentapeptide repeat-containing protein n=1 Tax=Devosia sp. 2618 TaxID=3156454 RepID=UPI0033947DDD
MKVPNLVLCFVAGAVVATVVVTSALNRWPLTADSLVGEIGILPFGVAILTVCFLGFNSLIARKGLANTVRAIEHSQKAEVATRYQKAADLLASDGQTARLGGIFLLRGVAMEDPDTYCTPALELLAAFAAERSAAIFSAVQALRDARQTHNHFGSEALREQASAKTPYDVAVALDIFGKLRAWHVAEFGELPNSERQLSLSSIAFHNIELKGGDFSGVNISGGSFYNCRFVSCDMSEVRINGRIGFRVFFSDCSLRHAQIDDDGERRKLDPNVKFEHCDTTGIRVALEGARALFVECDLGGLAEIEATRCVFQRCWSSDGAPIVDLNFRDTDQSVFEVDESATWSPETARGFRIYRPVENQLSYVFAAPKPHA